MSTYTQVLMMYCAILFSACALAEKTEVFKCPSKDGIPEFTDKPCDKGELITIFEQANAGLSMMVPDLPPLPQKPAKTTTPEPTINVVVVQAPPSEYNPWSNYVSYPMHHHAPPQWQPRPPVPVPPIDITPPRPRPPARPIRTRVELPESLQPRI